MTEGRVTRTERLAQIRALKSRGLTHRQIAEALGLTRSGVNAILTDPDGSKQRARRVRYQGVCADCGGPTDGGNGRGNAPGRCFRCARGLTPMLAVPSRRRCVQVRLCDLPVDVRLEAAREANRLEQGDAERLEILLAALYPSTQTYYVAAGAVERLSMRAAA